MQTPTFFFDSLGALSATLSADSYDYQYLRFGDGGVMSLVIGLLVGFFLACCLTVFDRRVLGDFVRHVLYNECFSKEEAKTLEELGYLKNSFVRGSLKNGVSLRRVVKCVEEEEFLEEVRAMREAYEKENEGKRVAPFKEPKFKMDVSTMHFYIPEELKYTADVKFEKKGANAITLLIALLLFAAVAAIAITVIPEILQMLDNMLGIFDQKNNIVT